MASDTSNLSEEEHDCLQAVRGQQVPKALDDEITQFCVIRGIRYHPVFATELHGQLPKFTRALNARAIMSDRIPEMDDKDPDQFPYCIWYPETAKEATYRALAARYPQMKYLELNLLPECHIAEEARENTQWEIYDAIMGDDVPARYNAMDDYTRTIFEPSRCFLNGDTAVRSYLDIKTKFEKLSESDSFFMVSRQRSYFDITEDDRIDEYTTPTPSWPSCAIKNDDVSHLLYQPLPLDLPSLKKDVLILMAAYYGDVDRYSRLRRPRYPVTMEGNCVILGIYHNPMFAKWWSLQPAERRFSSIDRAINARFIMNNDLSRIGPDTPQNVLPDCVCYPSLPHEATRRELFRRAPSMKQAIARVCILADHEDVWDLLGADPEESSLQDARASPNPKYLRDLESRLDRGVKEADSLPRAHMSEPNAGNVIVNVADTPAIDYLQAIPFDRSRANASMVELSVSIPDELKNLAKEFWAREGVEISTQQYYDNLQESNTLEWWI